MDLPHRRRIPHSFVLMLYEYLDEKGIDGDTVLALPRPRYSANLMGDLPIDDWQRMLQCAAERLNDPQLGLHLGQKVTPRHAGVLGYVVMASQSLGEALARLYRYQRLIYDVTPMVVRPADDGVELVWDAEHGRPGPLVDETAITSLVHLCRTLCGGGLAPRAVHFINPTPANIASYRDYFGCPVSFEQPETILYLDASLLERPLQTSDPALLDMLEAQAAALLASLPTGSPVVEEVRRRIGRLLHEREPAIEPVAASMGTSARTLQRCLGEVGTSFRQEVAAVRREVAERYLRETRLGIVDIALLLGYSEHSAFTRSFIRWTGKTPQHYRQQQGPRRSTQ